MVIFLQYPIASPFLTTGFYHKRFIVQKINWIDNPCIYNEYVYCSYNMKDKKIELLAPVGSFDCLQAAINAGADSVYFGVEQLNMRTRSAGTFTNADIKKIASICRSAKIRSYITLNTVMYEHDIQLLNTILKEVKKHKIDAVIASDFAVIECCNRLCIPLHISTQANISNIEAVQFYARFSDVVVLARELTLKQV